MIGHHIYARSWFELGSKTKNAGSFTVELTPGIFSGNQDVLINKSLNPMCATVPETLAPRNTDKSLLRIMHILPDATFVCRSWFVSDELTGRGTVPYSQSLIFSGEEDNKAFLKCPSKAFTSDAFERYNEFAQRAGTDAPAVLSTKYDPKKEDYVTPFTFSKQDWLDRFGINQNLFLLYFIHLCKAICERDGAKIAVILPEDGDGELLIQATLTLLPMFMKKKFGAASKWTGMMDGSSCTAVNGLHLLCYHDETPLSEAKYAVIDLTGLGRHQNINTANSEYASWLWDNLDNTDAVSLFERFLDDNFTGVLDKMPFEVIENCLFFYLVAVAKRVRPTLEIIYSIILKVVECFPKNFNKYPFIHRLLKNNMGNINQLLQRNPQADLPTEVIQSICLLANNGEEQANELIKDIYNHFYQLKDWRKVSVVLMYYANLLENPNITVETENFIVNVLNQCLKCRDASGEKIASDAISKYCYRKKMVALTSSDSQLADEALMNYLNAAGALHYALGKLTDNFFQLPELNKNTTINTKNFIKLVSNDIEYLHYVPSKAYWKVSIKWAAALSDDEYTKLFNLFYENIPQNEKRDYILSLEDTDVWIKLMTSSQKIYIDIIQTYVEILSEEWNKSERDIDADETWQFINEWLIRLDRLPAAEEEKYKPLHNLFEMTNQTLKKMAKTLSKESMETAYSLYASTDWKDHFKRICDWIDARASQSKSLEKLAMYINKNNNEQQSSLSTDTCYTTRMRYWYKNEPSENIEVAVALAVALSPNKTFSLDIFLPLCRSKRDPNNSNSKIHDVVDLLSAADVADGYQSNCEFIKSSIEKKIRKIVLTNWDELELIFSAKPVMDAYGKLNSDTWKTEIGSFIAEHLKEAGKINEDVLNVYKPKELNNTAETIGIFELSLCFAIAFAYFLLIFGISLLLFFSNRQVPIINGGVFLALPFVTAGIVLIVTTVQVLVFVLRKNNGVKGMNIK